MTGPALAVIGQVLFTGLSPHGNYAGEIVPSLILTGLGVGRACSVRRSSGARSASGQVTQGSPARYAAAFWWAAGLFARGFPDATFIIPKRTATPVSQPAAPEPERHRNHDGLPEPGPRSRQR